MLKANLKESKSAQLGFLNKNNFQNINLVMQKYKCVGKIDKICDIELRRKVQLQFNKKLIEKTSKADLNSLISANNFLSTNYLVRKIISLHTFYFLFKVKINFKKMKNRKNL